MSGIGWMLSGRSRWILPAVWILLFSALSIACSPEVGSDAWCDDMKETGVREWSKDDAKSFAKHCLFKS